MTDEVVPRPAATLLVVRDDPFEVLMVRRRGGGSFPSAVVFPGGVVEPDDLSERWATGSDLASADIAARVAAVRETWEETGILAGVDGAIAAADRALPFAEVLGESRVSLDGIVDFAHWVTPAVMPKRWDTRFFVVRAPELQLAEVDGTENVSLEWISPAEAIERNDSLMFPTRLNLMRLAESGNVEDALAAARARPRFVVTPQVEKTAHGIRRVIPLEAGYAETEELAST